MYALHKAPRVENRFWFSLFFVMKPNLGCTMVTYMFERCIILFSYDPYKHQATPGLFRITAKKYLVPYDGS